MSVTINIHNIAMSPPEAYIQMLDLMCFFFAKPIPLVLDHFFAALGWKDAISVCKCSEDSLNRTKTETQDQWK